MFINAVFWILRTGASWWDLPPDYGGWKNTHRHFCRWRDKWICEQLLKELVQDPDYEWLMIDTTHIKIHPHASEARGGNQEPGPYKRGLNTKIHMAMDAHDMPVRLHLTKGIAADCKHSETLIEEIKAQYLMAD